MTNEQLVIRIKAGEDVEENMQQLCIQVSKFIQAIARKYHDDNMTDDLIQEGYITLYPAINGYDPAAGCKFLTYAEYYIRQGMQRYLQNNGSCLRLPVHCLEKVQKYKKFVSEYEKNNGFTPSDWAVSKFLHCSLEQVEGIKKNACALNLTSLDSPITGADGGEDSTVGDFVPAQVNLEEDVTERFQHEQLKETLWSLVDELEGQQPEVIRCRYQRNMKLDEIGQACGINREKVRQIEAKALRCLRNPARSKHLRPFLPEADRIYSKALIGGGVGHFNQTWTSSTERVALDL